MSKRAGNYNSSEDKHLAQMWLDVTQDPIVGNNQLKTQFWQRILDKYKSQKPNSRMTDRNLRSVQSRMQQIMKDSKKFYGCLCQVELTNPSGANEQVIHERANAILMSFNGYKDGYKFEHVYPIIKEYLQTHHDQMHGGISSDLDENMESPNYPNPSPPSFTVNLSDDSNFDDSSSSGRSEGVKKSKLKRKQNEDKSSLLLSIKEENEKLRDLMTGSVEKRDRWLEYLQKKVEADQEKNRIRQQMRDDKILMINLDSIEYLECRMSVKFEQQDIMEKRRQARMANSSSNVYDMFRQFPDLGGSGNGHSNY